MSKFKIGDRVSWMGGLDFGRLTVRWHGRVTKVGLGASYYHEPPQYTDDGYAREAGRRPAVEVEPDYPQHGINGRPVHQTPCIVDVDALRREQ